MRVITVLLAFLALVLVVDVSSAAPFFTAPPAAEGVPPTGTGWWAQLFQAIYQVQADFYQNMTKTLGEMKREGTAGTWLMLTAFLYGVFHAAGPGHGKVVVSSYVLADNLALRKGIGLAFFSSFLQALTAIVLVSLLAIVLRMTRAELMGNVRWLEALSFALIALLGIWLVFKSARKLRALYIKSLTHSHSHRHTHTHTHGHDPTPSHAHGHGHDHSHDHTCGCGHSHMPDAHQARAVKDLRGFVMAAFSVGLRPCTGALVVLVFALSQGLFWAGVAATLFMGLGTALTVSLIASGAVGARSLTRRVFLGGYPVSSLYAGALVQGLAGGALAFVGLGLMLALMRPA